MKKDIFIKQIKKAALLDEQKRKNIKYKRAMAFLVQKGFLKTNTDFTKYYFAKIDIQDMIWAGKNVEPRILEVLPAAVVRLPKAIRLNENLKEIKDLKKVIEDLKNNRPTGHDFLNVPYEKTKVWMSLRLNDNRTKTIDEKKIMKTFRLNPETIQRLAIIKKEKNIQTDAELIDYLANSV